LAADANATLSSDGRIVVFTSDRRDTGHLWFALRQDPEAPFDAPQELTALNSDTTDWEPILRRDGCEIIFSSWRGTGDGIADL